ncbi:hypothetical protein AK812_SmicGene48951, partial [Symbiodinium microadriaticum]
MLRSLRHPEAATAVAATSLEHALLDRSSCLS